MLKMPLVNMMDNSWCSSLIWFKWLIFFFFDEKEKKHQQGKSTSSGHLEVGIQGKGILCRT